MCKRRGRKGENLLGKLGKMCFMASTRMPPFRFFSSTFSNSLVSSKGNTKQISLHWTAYGIPEKTRTYEKTNYNDISQRTLWGFRNQPPSKIMFGEYFHFAIILYKQPFVQNLSNEHVGGCWSSITDLRDTLRADGCLQMIGINSPLYSRVFDLFTWFPEKLL